MDAELKAERERLNARGLAVAEVETRLRALEAERQAALAAEVGQLRAGLRLQEMADARNEERLVGDRIRAALAQTLQRLQDDELAGARGSLAGLEGDSGRAGHAGEPRAARAAARGPAGGGGPDRAAGAARQAGSGRRRSAAGGGVRGRPGCPPWPRTRPWGRACRRRRPIWPTCARSWSSPGRDRGSRSADPGAAEGPGQPRGEPPTPRPRA